MTELNRKLEQFDEVPTDSILTFEGDFEFLSNMYVLPNYLPTEFGKVPTSEHVYMMAKFTHPILRQVIAAEKTGRQAKTIARKFEDAGVPKIEGWEDRKIEIMRDIVRTKFELNPELATKLVQTGDAHIEEGNTWGDIFWGISPPGSGNGSNHLGKILMQLRSQLRDDRTTAYTSW